MTYIFFPVKIMNDQMLTPFIRERLRFVQDDITLYENGIPKIPVPKNEFYL